MKYILSCLSILLLFSVSNAQDTLVYTNGNKKVVKIDEVNSAQIKFHKYENLGGPTYTVSTSEIKYIKYPNGTQDVFVSEEPKTIVKPEDDFIKPADHVYGKNNEQKKLSEDSLIYRKTNLIYTNLIDLMVLSPSINYERIQAKGNFSVWVPVNIGLNPYGSNANNLGYNSGGFWGVRKLYTAGLGFKYYFNGQKASSFFVAPLFEYGRVVYNKYIYSNNGYGGYGYNNSKKEQAPLLIGSINFGNLYSFKSGFILTLQGGLGVRAQKTKGTYNYNSTNPYMSYDYLIFPTVKFGFSVGYRF